MEELNVELLGRLQGYVNWSSEIVWHKQKHDSLKQQSLQHLKKHQKKGYKINAQLLKQLSDIVVKKQVPLHSQKVHVHDDIKETMNILKSVFIKTYPELFVEDAVYVSERMYEHAILLHDAVSRQALLLHALNQDTYEDVLPQLFFLCDKEIGERQKLQAYAQDVLVSSARVLAHMNNNYFVRMKKLASDSQYIEDHRQLFVAAYALALCSRALATLYDVSEDSNALEELFLSNVIQRK